MAVKIIAGPCSVDFKNKIEIKESLGIKYSGKSALYGVRIVGLKSRTTFDPENAFIGIDIEDYGKNAEKLTHGDAALKIMPSVEIANEIQAENKDIFIATEIVDSWIQCSVLSLFLKSKKAIVWNPAVNHLGFPVQVMARFARKNGWKIGIKNGKSLGGSVIKSEEENIALSLDKSWSGLTSYANLIPHEDIFMIHRGVDTENNAGYRNYPVHNLCARVKSDIKNEMFLDPSHIAGPKKRSDIVDFTVDSMKIKHEVGGFLYDGILLECGTSKSDTDQHITIAELEEIIAKISSFRKIHE